MRPLLRSSGILPLVLTCWLALVGCAAGPVVPTAEAATGPALIPAPAAVAAATVSYPRYGQRSAAVGSLQKKLIAANLLRRPISDRLLR